MVNIIRFIKQQEKYIKQVKSELKNGRKESHWMWFIFPQIKGLGRSEMSRYYAIKDLDEAKEYFENDYLKNNYLELCELLLKLEDKSSKEIFGYIDSNKLQSSLTLFYLVSKNKTIKDVLNKYYKGKLDDLTVNILNK